MFKKFGSKSDLKKQKQTNETFYS